MSLTQAATNPPGRSPGSCVTKNEIRDHVRLALESRRAQYPVESHPHRCHGLRDGDDREWWNSS